MVGGLAAEQASRVLEEERRVGGFEGEGVEGLMSGWACRGTRKQRGWVGGWMGARGADGLDDLISGCSGLPFTPLPPPHTHTDWSSQPPCTPQQVQRKIERLL